MGKLSLHLQYIPGWIDEFLDIAGPRYIKIMDPPEVNPFSGRDVRVIARFFISDDEANAMVQRGADGAREFFDFIAPRMRVRPWVWAVEGPNEPQPMANVGFREALAEFTIALGDMVHAEGWRFVGLNLSVGWPDIGDAVDLGPALAHMDVVGLHEYSARAMWDGSGYYCLRYRRTIQEWVDAGFTVPPVFIGECGIDGGVIGQAGSGWREYVTRDEYLDQLLWYSGELEKDGDLILAAVVFTVSPQGWGWDSFRVERSLAMGIANIDQGDSVQPPNGDAGIGVYDAGGGIRDWAWLQSEYGDIGVSVGSGPHHLVEVHEDTSGISSVIVRVNNSDGLPVGDYPVVWQWPDGSVDGRTKQDGSVDFAMGTGAYYYPPQGGPHTVIVDGETVSGLGMIGETNHHHVNLVFAETDGDVPTYVLSVRTSGDGQVLISPQESEYQRGTIVTLDAVPESGWRFDRWLVDDDTYFGPTIQITMDRDYAVTATFVRQGDDDDPDIEAAISAGLAAIEQIETALRALGATP